MLRLLVADDHEVVRRGVRVLLETRLGWQVCQEASDGAEAVEKAGQSNPDVVILDVGMPVLDGLEAARRIRKACPRSEVLILTLHDSEQIAHEVLAAGARGYVLKSDTARDLIAAVEAVSRHRPFFNGRVGEKALRRAAQGQQTVARTASRLTPREREVAKALAEGGKSRDTALALGISVKTANTHRANIMRKLGCHSLSDLVRYAIRNKIVEP
jgi:DNA-binding NarL/FixJ family response regulator